MFENKLEDVTSQGFCDEALWLLSMNLFETHLFRTRHRQNSKEE